MNPRAPITWALLTCLGWLIGATTGAVVGLSIGLTLTIAANIYRDMKGF